MTTGEKILKLRKESGLSQEAFAEKLGVSRQSVSKWESGVSIPETDKILAMSEMFRVSTDYLLKDDEVKAEEEIEPEEEANQTHGGNEETENKKTFSGKKLTAVLATVLAAGGIVFTAKKLTSGIKKAIAIVAIICIIITAICVPVHFGGIKETWWALCGGKVEYPYVLVHGLGGWGETTGVNNAVTYWGSTTGDLTVYLEEQGYTVHAPSVGPLSSTWDRVCELYAQLTGTTVDYGEAHSKEHNHARYGREYTTPLVENWGEKINGGQRVKINLVGHSFGGATVRLLTSLLEYGNEAEMNATGDETSPLFTGKKGDWVHSVTSLCAPHNGSSLTCIIDSIGSVAGFTDSTQLLVSLCFGVAGIAKPASGVYDFMLDQFGVGEISGSSDDVADAFARVADVGNDHAGYDLSPDGAAALNKTIRTVKGVYYFSYSYLTTKDGSLLSGQVPDSGTFAVLYPTALAMGSYKGTTNGGIVIDEAWQPNDGLVSVVSAQYPTGEEWTEYNDKKVQRGIWNVMPTRKGDHGKVIGLNADTEETHKFYIDHFNMVDELKR